MTRDTPYGSDCDGVVAPEHERDLSELEHRRDARRQVRHRRLNERKIFELGVADFVGFRLFAVDIAVIGHVIAEIPKRLTDPGFADRRRPHIDAATPCTQIHAHPEDAHLLGHVRKSNTSFVLF